MRASLAALAFSLAAPTAAHALAIELKDVAADRVERQRAAAIGALPLPGTPNVAVLNDRLRQSGVSMNAAMMIRVFKAESELEVWKEKDGAYVLFATYPICHWSGTIGPKLRSGDKQAPEGFYTVALNQIRHVGRWPKSLNLGFPNVLDQAEARTGSHILIHGGCTSVGCFAMTNPVMEEIHRLTNASLRAGQKTMPVHVFPFRMTDTAMTKYGKSTWSKFWANMKEGYDTFEASKRPPRVSVCDGRYLFSPVAAGEDVGAIDACPSTIAAIRDQDQWLRGLTPASVNPRQNLQVVNSETTGPAPTAANGAASEVDTASIDGQGNAGGIEGEPTSIRAKCSHALANCPKPITVEQFRAARRIALLSRGLRDRGAPATTPAPMAASSDVVAREN